MYQCCYWKCKSKGKFNSDPVKVCFFFLFFGLMEVASCLIQESPFCALLDCFRGTPWEWKTDMFKWLYWAAAMLLWKEKTIIKLTLRVWWLNVVNHLSKEEMPVRKLNLWVKKRDLIYILQLRKNVSNYVKQRRKNKFPLVLPRGFKTYQN